jgi:hypothetical protein
VRGDDRSSRYPPGGVWFGLILAVGIVRAATAQDDPEAEKTRRLADPVVLAANRVTQWKASDGIWVRLAGDASVLQGVEGVRAREAVVRIVDVSSGGEKISQVEVYAEGQVRVTGSNNSGRPSYRGVLRTAEVQLRSYDPAGPKTEKVPPSDLAIIRRSSLRAPKPIGGEQTATRGEPLPARGPAENPSLPLASADASASGAGPIGATQAVAPTSQPPPDAGSAATTTAAAAASAGGTNPRRDPMVQRAQYAGNPAPSAATRAEAMPSSDARVQQARAPQAPRAGAQPPDVDLPPIEGAPEVQVPNLRTNP